MWHSCHETRRLWLHSVRHLPFGNLLGDKEAETSDHKRKWKHHWRLSLQWIWKEMSSVMRNLSLIKQARHFILASKLNKDFIWTEKIKEFFDLFICLRQFSDVVSFTILTLSISFNYHQQKTKFLLPIHPWNIHKYSLSWHWSVFDPKICQKTKIKIISILHFTTLLSFKLNMTKLERNNFK